MRFLGILSVIICIVFSGGYYLDSSSFKVEEAATSISKVEEAIESIESQQEDPVDYVPINGELKSISVEEAQRERAIKLTLQEKKENYTPIKGTQTVPNISTPRKSDLYLIEKASEKIFYIAEFEEEVRRTASKLQIPPSWLMSVMDTESGFNSAVKNFKGSGATGLIQFMPSTAKELNTSTSELQKMTPVYQMDFVYKYLAKKRPSNGYNSLADFYLSVLYPRAVNRKMSYVLFRKGTRAYTQNSGLDKNKDGKVSVLDIVKHMSSKYPKAYAEGTNKRR